MWENITYNSHTISLLEQMQINNMPIQWENKSKKK